MADDPKNIVTAPQARIKIADKDGNLAPFWFKFFRDIYNRTSNKGGNAIDDRSVISHFQARKSSALAVNTSLTDITAWDDEDVSGDIFSWDDATGELTINANGAAYISGHNLAIATTSNRVEMQLFLLKNGVALPGAQDNQYAMRQTAQDEGSVQINNYYVAVSSGDVFKLQNRRVGTTANTVIARLNVMFLGG